MLRRLAGSRLSCRRGGQSAPSGILLLSQRAEGLKPNPVGSRWVRVPNDRSRVPDYRGRVLLCFGIVMRNSSLTNRRIKNSIFVGASVPELYDYSGLVVLVVMGLSYYI